MQLFGLECTDVRVVGTLSDIEGRLLASAERPLPEAADPGPAIRAVLEAVLPHAAPVETSAVVALPQAFRADRSAVRELLAPMLTLGPRLWRCSPMEAIASGALNGSPGLAVHCGLRAAAIGLHPNGRVLTAGQADTPLGDEGSALWMTVRLVKIVLHGLERRTPPNPRLEKSLSAYFGTESFEALLASLERGHVRANELTGFVAVILQLATYPNPDPACRVLVLQASRQLIEMTRYVIEQSGFGDELRIGSWSGPALAGPLLAEFRHAATHEVPEIRWKDPLHDATRGTLLLALASLHLPPPAAPLDAVSASVWTSLFHMQQPWA